jgi:hypothetical protein
VEPDLVAAAVLAQAQAPAQALVAARAAVRVRVAGESEQAVRGPQRTAGSVPVSAQERVRAGVLEALAALVVGPAAQVQPGQRPCRLANG